MTGVILAAGASSRMGMPKALLAAASGDSFLATLISTFDRGGVDDILIVIRPGEPVLAAAAAAVPTRARVRVIENPAAELGQISSLHAALDAVDRGTEAVIAVPVDMPLVKPSTVSQLIDAHRLSGSPIVRPCYHGRHGHPVLFARAVFEELRRVDPSLGARAVVHARGAHDIDVDDAGVLQDVDTPADYERVFGYPAALTRSSSSRR